MKKKKLRKASGGMAAHVENVDADTIATVNNSKEVVETTLNGEVERKIKESRITIF